MIHIYINPSCFNEKIYILNVIFNHWFELNYEVHLHEDKSYKITLPNNLSICIPDIFLSMEDEKWLSHETLPTQVVNKSLLDNNHLNSSPIPCIFLNANQEENRNFSLHLDIFGSIFYLISCYEEGIIQKKDNHNRFSFTESFAYKYNFYDKPMVNEYLEILWEMLVKASPRIQRKKRIYKVEISHDVDRPYNFLWMTKRHLLKNIAHLALKKNSPHKVPPFLIHYFLVKSGFTKKDPFYTFDWIMDVSEKYNINSTFNFIAGRHSPLDALYSIDDEEIKQLMEIIHKRGHLIGLHGSYNSYNNFNILKNEYNVLSRAMENAKIKQNLESSRQHYLRWDTPVTPNLLDKVGLKYDTTLSYAETPGFRCGTCYEFPMYDLINRQELGIIQKPLIVMEGSVLDYLGLSPTEGKVLIISLAQKCRRFNGTFSLLWHNNELDTKWKKNLYLEVIEAVS